MRWVLVAPRFGDFVDALRQPESAPAYLLLLRLVLQVDTNLSMIRFAAAAEWVLGKPVIAINTATYWHALRACGINDKLQSFGKLLSHF